jgi:hypothetical protein
MSMASRSTPLQLTVNGDVHITIGLAGEAREAAELVRMAPSPAGPGRRQGVAASERAALWILQFAAATLSSAAALELSHLLGIA